MKIKCAKTFFIAIAIITACAVVLAGALSACAPAIIGKLSADSVLKAYSREFYYLNTVINITLYASYEREGESALDAAEAVFERVHKLMDRFGEYSDIYKINHAPPGGGPVRVGAETFSLIKKAIGYCEQSGGAFDIGIGAVSDLWGFTAQDGEVVNEGAAPPDRRLLEDAVAAGGYKKIILDESELSVEMPPGMMIDLGGIAKGYAVKSAAAVLVESGIINAVIDAGGNVHVIGGRPGTGSGTDAGRPWKVGIRHPRPAKTGDLLAVVSVTDKSIVTSGDYVRYYEYEGTRYHHILDPSTGMPARSSISATIIADDSALADYLSTAVFVLGPEEGLKLVAQYPGAEAIVVAPDMSVTASPGFDGEILLK